MRSSIAIDFISHATHTHIHTQIQFKKPSVSNIHTCFFSSNFGEKKTQQRKNLGKKCIACYWNITPSTPHHKEYSFREISMIKNWTVFFFFSPNDKLLVEIFMIERISVHPAMLCVHYVVYVFVWVSVCVLISIFISSSKLVCIHGFYIYIFLDVVVLNSLAETIKFDIPWKRVNIFSYSAWCVVPLDWMGFIVVKLFFPCNGRFLIWAFICFVINQRISIKYDVQCKIQLKMWKGAFNWMFQRNGALFFQSSVVKGRRSIVQVVLP